jgi:hypothetical protein
MHTIVCCAISSILASPMDLNELIKRHEEGLSQIRSIKAKIELRVSEDGGETWKKTLEYSVLKNGRDERYSARYHYAPSSGYADGKILPADGFTDFLTNPDGRRTIAYGGLTPDETPSGTIDVEELESTGRKINGAIEPPEPFGPAGYKSRWLIPIMLAADLRFTLRELCAGSSPVLVSVKNARGETIYELNVSEPGGVRRYVMSFDPSHNYLITHVKNLDNKGKPLEWFAELSVVDFQEPKQGIFLPKTIRGTSRANAGRIYEVSVSDAIINEPFDEEKLHHLEFPPGIVVIDTSHAECYHIWGDGKPARTFAPDEFRAWKLERLASFSRRSRHGGWRGSAIWIAGSTLVLAGVLWIRRLVLRRQQTA